MSTGRSWPIAAGMRKAEANPLGTVNFLDSGHSTTWAHYPVPMN